MADSKKIEIGYINFGYISPEITSDDTYPDYIRNEVSDTVCKIQEVQNRNSITFGFMTDIHYSKTYTHDIRTRRLFNAYNEVKKRVGSDMLILGGDYINDGCREYKTNNYRELRAHIDGAYFPVNGNHDDNSIWDLFIEADDSVSHLTTEEMYNIFYNHLPKLGAKFDEKNDGLYYYYDDCASKVRYIFLDTADIPYKFDENGKLVYTKQHTFAISQKQIDWFISDALGTASKDYDVVVISHTFYKAGNKELENLFFINDILDCYKLGRKLDKTYCDGDFEVEVKMDFENKERANLIACFAGHFHKDMVEHTASGIPIIYSDCSIMYDYKTKRTDSDKSEIIFDMVTINRSEKKIYVTRCGAGEDRVVEFE